MSRKSTDPVCLAWLLVLVLLGGCGGSAEDAVPRDPLAIATPTAEDHVAIALRAGEKPEILRGPSEQERKHGPNYEIWPKPFVAELRAAVEAQVPWSRTRNEIDRQIDREGTRLRLEVVEDGVVLRTIEQATMLTSQSDNPADMPPLDIFVRRSEEGLHLDASVYARAWYARHGCDAVHTWTWHVDGPALPREAEAVLEEIADACLDESQAFHARVREPSAKGRMPVSTGQMALVLDALVRAGFPRLDIRLVGGARGFSRLGAVERALYWLAERQSPDGLWRVERDQVPCADDDEFPSDRAMAPGPLAFRTTGLALTTFLGAGFTNRGRHPLAKVVARGVKALRNVHQRDDGTFEPPGTPGRAGSHAITTTALVQLYELTESPYFHDCAARALAALPSVWQEEAERPEDTGFALLATAMGRLAVREAESRGEDAPWAIPPAFLETLYETCRAWTRSRDDFEFAVGVAGCLLLGDDAKDAPWRDRLRQVTARVIASEAPDPRIQLFVTIATWRARGDVFKTWGKHVKDALVPAQQGGPFCCHGGSWDPVPGLAGARIEATALHGVVLEYYYRYDKVVGSR